MRADAHRKLAEMVEACDGIDGIEVVDSGIDEQEMPQSFFHALFDETTREVYLVVTARLTEGSDEEDPEGDREAVEIDIDDVGEEAEPEREKVSV